MIISVIFGFNSREVGVVESLRPRLVALLFIDERVWGTKVLFPTILLGVIDLALTSNKALNVSYTSMLHIRQPHAQLKRGGLQKFHQKDT